MIVEESVEHGGKSVWHKISFTALAHVEPFCDCICAISICVFESNWSDLSTISANDLWLIPQKFWIAGDTLKHVSVSIQVERSGRLWIFPTDAYINIILAINS